MFSWLLTRLRRSPRQRTDLHVLLYTRAGCHLCTDAWDLLILYQKLRGFTLEKIDVDTDPVLVSRYGACVPVVTVNGEVRFRGRVNRVLLERILDARMKNEE
jgi:hypothetical protein